MVELIFFLAFLSGLVMKLFHLPGHTLVMGIGLLAMLIYYVVSLVVSTSGKKRTSSWLGLSTVSWLIFFLAEVKFMGGTLILMMLALFVSVLSLLMTLKEPGVLSPGRIIVLLAALFLAASTSWMELHTRYYVFNIHFSTNVWNDYVMLDKYSWFLYNDQEYEEALVINSKAHEAANAKGALDYIPTVEQHEEAIIKRNWGSFE